MSSDEQGYDNLIDLLGSRSLYLVLYLQMIVFDRKEPIQKVIETCRGKLKIKKRASGAALLEGEEVGKA